MVIAAKLFGDIEAQTATIIPRGVKGFEYLFLLFRANTTAIVTDG